MSVRSDNDDGNLMIRQTLSGTSVTNKEPLPPRHRRSRRKEEELTTNQSPSINAQRESLLSRGVQFDLEEASFPPLPGKIFINFLKI